MHPDLRRELVEVVDSVGDGSGSLRAVVFVVPREAVSRCGRMRRHLSIHDIEELLGQYLIVERRQLQCGEQGESLPLIHVKGAL